jgi:hypothetical protein
MVEHKPYEPTEELPPRITIFCPVYAPSPPSHGSMNFNWPYRAPAAVFPATGNDEAES